MSALRRCATPAGRFIPVGGRRATAATLFAALLLSAASVVGADHRHGHEHGHRHHHPHPHETDRRQGRSQESRLDVARALQRKHEFDAAAVALSLHVETNPLDIEAQLLHADVLWHAGRLEEARRACIRVALAGSAVLAGYCAAQVLIAEGDFAGADRAATALAAGRQRLPDAARQWALEISAEAAWRAGRWDSAESLYEQALDFAVVPHSTKDGMRAFRAAIEN